MISGGLTEGKVGLSSVEIYDPSAPPVTRSCQISPNMPTSRSSTVAHGSVVCGGYGGHPRDCIELRDGAWQTAYTLNQNRIWYNWIFVYFDNPTLLPNLVVTLHITPYQHNDVHYRSSTWNSSKGLVIMAGSGASTTTEILRDDLTSDPYFNITETR